ncbi:uncharacterized protein LOC122293596 [Carya illinoinensis]|uniref:uncharacterized protein LOC122293596 n=1 Tax=Carya illinoinensis TaxID=32201 RepID=UPI001C71A8E7|nr:uncharacterized protein LOC122293596 [Carya illinoinensis]
MDLFESLMQELDEVSLQEFVVVARRVWWRRNCFIFNNDFKHPKSVIREAHATLTLLNGENNNITTSPSLTCRSPDVWTHPPPNWYKINWDSSVNKQKYQVGVGVIVRDCKGHVMATMRHNKQMYPDPLLAESYGALQAAKLGVDLGLRQIILEGDSLQVINTLHEDRDGLSSALMFLYETKVLLKQFAKWEISHVRRNGNVLAHVLAKDSLSISDLAVTVEDVPQCIFHLVQ